MISMAKAARKTNNTPPCSVCGSHLIDSDFQIITRTFNHRSFIFHVCSPCQNKHSERAIARTLKKRVAAPYKLEVPTIVVQTSQSEPVMMEK
jgi:hypothetical protein